MFSVLQHSGPLDGQMNEEDALTPAGLLSPRAPATGLPRAVVCPASSASSTRQRDSITSGDGLGIGSSNGAGSTGPGSVPGEISFAALGLTSASHPQSSGASGIGSPLFGSEDGSSRDGEDGDEEPKTPTKRISEASSSNTKVVAGGKGLGRRLRKALSIIDDEEKSRHSRGSNKDGSNAAADDDVDVDPGGRDSSSAVEAEPADSSADQHSDNKHSFSYHGLS